MLLPRLLMISAIIRTAYKATMTSTRINRPNYYMFKLKKIISKRQECRIKNKIMRAWPRVCRYSPFSSYVCLNKSYVRRSNQYNNTMRLELKKVGNSQGKSTLQSWPFTWSGLGPYLHKLDQLWAWSGQETRQRRDWAAGSATPQKRESGRGTSCYFLTTKRSKPGAQGCNPRDLQQEG